MTRTAAVACGALALFAAAASRAADLDATLAAYPIKEGRYWRYEVLDIRGPAGKRHAVKGRLVVTARNIQSGRNGRSAVLEEELEVIEVKSEDPANRPLIGGRPGITMVAVEDKVYSFAPIVASAARDRIQKAMDNGVSVMEEWRQLPKYVFPLRVGSEWSDGRERYRVVARGPKQTPAGTFPDCYRIVGDEDGWEMEEWFCNGVGPVHRVHQNPGRNIAIENLLSGYGP